MSAETVDLKTARGWHQDSISAEGWRDRTEEDFAILANDQFSDEEKKILKGRNQQPIVLNRVHRDYWIQVGRQIRNRQEPTAKPVGKSDQGIARAITDCIKFAMNVNGWDYELTQTVCDQLGVRGWLKVGLQREDLTKEPIKIEHIPWREMRIDPVSRRMDLADAKYVIRERWVDLSDAKAWFPGKSRQLSNMTARQSAGSQQQPTLGYEPQSGDPYEKARDRGQVAEYITSDRKRVRLVECWYRTTVQVWHAMKADGGVTVVAKDSPEMLQAAMDPGTRLVYGPNTQINMIIFCGDITLASGKSPYKHGMFPYFCAHAFRANTVKKTSDLMPNEPYGMIRVAKDPQKLHNYTHTRVRHILGSRQVVMGKGVANREQVEQNASSPGGIIELDDPNGRFEFVDMLGQASALLGLMQLTDNELQAATGINEASRGDGPEQSGKAMFARQQQSEVTNTILVDNQRLLIHLVGLALVSLIQQTYTTEKIIRITEDKGDRVVAVNVTDPQRAEELKQQGIDVYGDITQGQYDITVDEVDATATRQEQDNEFIMQLSNILGPQWTLAHADLLLENTQTRNRDEMVARTKKVQGMNGLGDGPPPGAEPPPPDPNESISIGFKDLPPWAQIQVLAKIGIQAPEGIGPADMVATHQQADQSHRAGQQVQQAQVQAGMAGQDHERAIEQEMLRAAMQPQPEPAMPGMNEGGEQQWA